VVVIFLWWSFFCGGRSIDSFDCSEREMMHALSMFC